MLLKPIGGVVFLGGASNFFWFVHSERNGYFPGQEDSISLLWKTCKYLPVGPYQVNRGKLHGVLTQVRKECAG